jgi:hypothetical protein
MPRRVHARLFARFVVPQGELHGETLLLRIKSVNGDLPNWPN